MFDRPNTNSCREATTLGQIDMKETRRPLCGKHENALTLIVFRHNTDKVRNT